MNVAVISLYRMESRMQVNWSEIKIQFSVRTLVFATVFVALLISTSLLAAPHIRSLFLNLSHKPGPFLSEIPYHSNNQRSRRLAETGQPGNALSMTPPRIEIHTEEERLPFAIGNESIDEVTPPQRSAQIAIVAGAWTLFMVCCVASRLTMTVGRKNSAR